MPVPIEYEIMKYACEIYQNATVLVYFDTVFVTGADNDT
jgi:hypothetical protein